MQQQEATTCFAATATAKEKAEYFFQ